MAFKDFIYYVYQRAPESNTFYRRNELLSVLLVEYKLIQGA